MISLQAFLAQESIDKLLLSYFSSTRTNQVNALLSSILVKLVSQTNPLQYLYTQCQYQLQVNNNDKESTLKLAILLHDVITKSSYAIKKASFANLIQILQFCMQKVFITICSNEYIMLIGAIVSIYQNLHPLTLNKKSVKDQDLKCSQEKNCNSNSNSKSKTKCNSNCNCQNNKSQNQSQNKIQNNEKKVDLVKTQQKSFCCKGQSHEKERILQQIQSHQKLAKIIVSLLNNSKMHVGSYKQTIRHVLYKLLVYMLNVVQFSQDKLSKIIQEKSLQSQMIQEDSEISQNQQLFFVNIGITKTQLIQLVLKSAQSEKDPRNIALVFSSYKIILNLFYQQIGKLNYKLRIYQNLQAYYPIDMVGDQDNKDHQKVNLLQIKNKLQQCLLDDLFQEQVRQMLIDKMMSPPVNSYIGLYSLFINKFNYNLNKKNQANQLQLIQKRKKYDVMTLNLLLRLTQDEYLNQSGEESYQESMAYLIKTILLNVFRTKSDQIKENNYSACRFEVMNKFITFLSQLLVLKLLNFKQNNKFAGTILAIVKDIFNSGQNSYQQVKISFRSSMMNFKQILFNFIVYKFMQNWTANGDLAFKIGLLIVALNYKITTTLQSVSKYQDSSQNLQLLLITLGNIYEQNKNTESNQILIMVLKTLMILKSIFEKQNSSHPSLNRIKILNNSIIHKDCQKVVNLLNKQKVHIKNNDDNKVKNNQKQINHMKQQKKLQNTSKQFQNKDPVFLKCYIDYILTVYNRECQLIKSVCNLILYDMDPNTQINNLNEIHVKSLHNISPLQQVKLYAITGFLALHVQKQYKNQTALINSNKQKYVQIFQQSQQQIFTKISKTFFQIIITDNKQCSTFNFNKLNKLFQVYSFPILIRIFVIVFSNKVVIQLISRLSLNLSCQKQQQNSSFFIKLTQLSKLLSEKYRQFYEVQLMTQGDQFFQQDLIEKFKLFETNQNNKEFQMSALLGVYLLKKLWIPLIKKMSKPSSSIKVEQQNKKNNVIEYILSKISCQPIIKKNLQNQNYFLEQNSKLIKKRIITYFSIYGLIQSSDICLLQILDSLDIVQYHKKQKNKNGQFQENVYFTFQKQFASIYNPCVIQFYWNTIIKQLKSNKNQQITQQNQTNKNNTIQQKIVQMVQFLPKKILVASAVYILPILVLEKINTNVKTNKLQESKNIQKVIVNSTFIFKHIKTVSKIVQNLPQNLLIQQILPYSLQFLKNSSHDSQILSIQPILANNKILYQLRTIAESKNLQGLRKILIKQKPNMKHLLQKQIFHRKRVIRQSTRNLITTYDEMVN